MKANIHPTYNETQFTCTCGNQFSLNSTLGETAKLDVCSNCHPFYTGTTKLADTAGRIERFNKKYSKFQTKK